MATLRISLHGISSSAIDAPGAPVLDLPPLAFEAMAVGAAAVTSGLSVPTGSIARSGFVTLYGDADMLVSAGPNAPATVEMFLPAFTQLTFRVSGGNKIIARTS